MDGHHLGHTGKYMERGGCKAGVTVLNGNMQAGPMAATKRLAGC